MHETMIADLKHIAGEIGERLVFSVEQIDYTNARSDRGNKKKGRNYLYFPVMDKNYV